MTPERLRRLLDDVAAGRLGAEDALGQLKRLPFETLDQATWIIIANCAAVFSEVLAAGKTPGTESSPSRAAVANDQTLLITRGTCAGGTAGGGSWGRWITTPWAYGLRGLHGATRAGARGGWALSRPERPICLAERRRP
jgi:hypothetical protein